MRAGDQPRSSRQTANALNHWAKLPTWHYFLSVSTERYLRHRKSYFHLNRISVLSCVGPYRLKKKWVYGLPKMRSHDNILRRIWYSAILWLLFLLCVIYHWRILVNCSLHKDLLIFADVFERYLLWIGKWFQDTIIIKLFLAPKWWMQQFPSLDATVYGFSNVRKLNYLD